MTLQPGQQGRLRLLSEIGRDAQAVVYQAARGTEILAVKVLTGPFADVPEARAHLRREAALFSRIRHPGLPRIWDVDEVEGRPCLVMEYVDGDRLTDRLAQAPLPERETLQLAEALAQMLHEIHRHGLVHQNVTPHNIRFDRNRVVRLVHYGAPAGGAPDRRADLHALGLVLLEAATGGRSLPNAAISPALAAIIAKLTAPEPADRYQSAASLLMDLRKLDMVSEDHGTGSIAFGLGDRGADVEDEWPIVGRGDESIRIQALWRTVLRGRGGILLVEGEPGVGKSRLTREFLRVVSDSAAVILAAQCTQADPVPFGAIRNALDTYLRAPTEKMAARIHSAAADMAPLIRHLSPRLGALLAADPDLSADAVDQEVFTDAVAEFLCRLAREAEGLILVIDGVQWLDRSTYEVVRRLQDKLQQVPLLVIATARNDTPSAAGLVRFVAAASDLLVDRIHLEPLGPEARTQLVATYLGGHLPAPDLAHLIAVPEAGNPLVLGERVRTVMGAGLLYPRGGEWVLDGDGLDNLPLPIDAVGLLARRIEALPVPTVEALRWMALLGPDVGLGLLRAVGTANVADPDEAVLQAEQAGLLASARADGYRFVHEMVGEALLAGLDEPQLRRLHQRVAEALDEWEGAPADLPYLLARHYALGEPDRNPARCVAACYTAGQAALRAFAMEVAHGYMSQAWQIAQRFDLPPDVTLAEALGDLCARTGRLVDAQRHVERALSLTTLPLLRARLWLRLARIHRWEMDSAAARSALAEGFREAGLGAPDSPLVPLAMIRARVEQAIRTRSARRVPELDEHERERVQVQWNLCELAAELALLAGESPWRLLNQSWRSLALALPLGSSTELALAFAGHGFLLSLGNLRRQAERCFEQALAMGREVGNVQVRARVLFLSALASHFRGDTRVAASRHRRFLAEYGRLARTTDYLNSMSDLFWNLQMRGYERDLWPFLHRAVERAHVTEAGRAARIYWWADAYAGPVLTILGRSGDGRDRLAGVEQHLGDNPASWETFISYQVLTLVERGDGGEQLDQLLDTFYRKGLHRRRGTLHFERFYIFQAHARIWQHRHAPAEEKGRRLAQVHAAGVALKRVGNHPTLLSHKLVIRGAIAALGGQRRRALSLLERAEVLANRVDSPWCHYEIACVRARIYRDAGDHEAGVRYARIAYGMAVDQGWVTRADRVRQEFAVGAERTPRPIPTTVMDPSVTRLRRHLEALLQVSLASASTLNPREQARAVLDAIVRILGAERAFLLECSEGTTQLSLTLGRSAEGTDVTDLQGYSRTVVDQVRVTRAPVLSHGSGAYPLSLSDPMQAGDLRSIVATPLMMRERLLGVVYVDNRLARGIFSEEDAEIMAALANHIAIAMEMARVAHLQVEVESERLQRRLADSLRDLTHALNAAMTQAEVVERFMAALPRITPHDAAAVLYGKEGVLQVLASQGFGENEPLAGQTVILTADEQLYTLVKTRKALVVPNTEGGPPFPWRGPIRSWIAAPLVSNREVVGLLILGSEVANTFDQYELEIVDTAAGPVGLALEKARLFDEVKRRSITDDLTQAYNRRHLMDTASREFSRAARRGFPLAVIMLDVDHFKTFNDTYGHFVGDEVLRAVVQRCTRSLRESDVLGRYGGEEFAVILPDTTAEGARMVAERLQKAISGEPLLTGRGPLSVTVSMGIASLTGPEDSLAALLNRADAALYAAKSAGRNRVMVSNETIET